MILALPLLSVPPWFHPASWAKSIVFRIIFSVLIFLFIWEILFNKERLKLFWQRIRRGPVALPFWLLVALLGIFSLATIFSLDPRFSFWSSPYRGGGFLTFGLCIMFAILLFLILRKRDWQKIIDFTLAVGALVALIAIFQKLGLFSEYMIAYTWRPVSTMGGPIFLALYLVLLVFLSLAFGITTKGKKKIFYFSCLILLFIGILLAATRAIFLGLGIGFLFFIFFYPVRSISNERYSKKIVWLKILTGVILISGILGIFWLRDRPQFVQTLEENKIFGATFERSWQILGGESSITKYIIRSRGGGWQVLFEGIKDRPLLGYGPENLSIAFDKYYDSSLPGIRKGPGGSGGWWDRGHSFIFDISISAGIPALIIYLSLFGVLFWQLQKIKRNQRQSAIISENQNPIIAHGLQTTFIGYLTANLFSFDVFATYLISFLLITYSLYLISSNRKDTEQFSVVQRNNQRKFSGQSELKPWKYVFLVVLFCFLTWFIWSANIKPLQVNKEINEVGFYLDKVKSVARENPALAKQQYLKLLEKMDKILDSHTFIDNYLRLNYIDLITPGTKIIPEKRLELSVKATQLLEECIKLRPYYTRSWIYLGVYTNNLIKESSDELEIREELIKKAYSYLEKANQLSPKRPEVFVRWIETDLLNRKYLEAKEKSEQCINFNPDFGDCWWTKALSLFALDQIEKATECMEIAAQKGYSIEARNALSSLVKVYVKLAKDTGELKYYETLAGLYQKLIGIEYGNFQYHASLAFVYKELGEYDKAREEAMIVVDLSPESKENVEAFLKSLPK